ncbi:Kinesin-like protein KIF16B [Cyphomyrmex costatus]|uniref:Kinesin-like protein KIF16B n=1 Tax=Cyphomyrmex costatus TaxID=456900 RepID=A0A195C780_9HYME|nr:Kinesin-like protein KIF16B [Cyphomyrmex costatus]
MGRQVYADKEYDELIKPIMVVTKFVSFWPLEKNHSTNAKMFRTCHVIWLFFLFISMCISVTVDLVYNFNNLDELTACASMGTAFYLATLRLIIYTLFQKDMLFVIEIMRKDWTCSSYEDKVILKEKCLFAFQLAKCFIIMVIVTVTFFAYIPIIETYILGKEKIFPFRGYFYVNQSVTPIYECIYIFNVMGGFFAAGTIAGGTIFNFVAITHGSAKFAVLRKKLEAMNSNDPDIDRVITNCIKDHQNAITFADALERIINILVLGQFIVSTGLVCFAGFQITAMLENKIRLMKYWMFLNSAIIELFMFSFSGHALIDEAKRVLSTSFSYIMVLMTTNEKSPILTSLSTQLQQTLKSLNSHIHKSFVLYKLDVASCPKSFLPNPNHTDLSCSLFRTDVVGGKESDNVQEDPGLIPRLCKGIFSKIEQESEHERIYRVTVSYLEIYNERVRDLLKPSTSTSGLRLREHPRLGPYVQEFSRLSLIKRSLFVLGLTHHVVCTLGSLISYVEEGTKARKTASTLQNPSSSRSHALLTVDLSQETADAERPNSSGTSLSSRRQDATPHGGSRLHLVDLAGSESAATCSGVHRLKEGANINKSLVALGNVISALAERGSTGSRPGRRYIPYRDSSLTWLLKDALGGNATTIMLATISPASGSYNETAHTLRFAQRAQSVVNRPVVNEDPVERIIRELRAEVARLKSLLLEKARSLRTFYDIDQTKAPCCCSKVQSSKNSATDPQYRQEHESINTSQFEESNHKNRTVQSKDNRNLDTLPIRRYNSSDSVTAYETSSSGSIRKFNSYEHLQLPHRFNYNQAKITELNDEDDEVVDEINEPVFVDIPTLVAVLIKPDNSLQESSTQIEEICSDEVQEDSIDADFIEGSNEDFEGSERIDDVDPDDRSSSANSCILKDSEIVDLHQITSGCSSPSPIGRSKPRGKFSKQNSIDLSSSNLNVSKKFGSIDGISKKKEPIFGVQRSHTNIEKRSTLSERGKKLNNIREIDDRKANVKSSNIWRAIGNKDHLQRKSSNESDKSLKDSISGRTGSYNSIGRKSSLESLKRKTSKDSSSSSSKDEQISISSLTRDKIARRKSSLDQEAAAAAAGGLKHHTAIQKVKRAEIVAAVTERLYSSRKHIEETNMASNNASGIRSPPEGIDVKMPNSLIARSRLQEISRKMLLKRRKINVDTQTETASTLRFKDTACLTDQPKVVLQDAAVLTDDHADGDVAIVAMDRRLPVLRVKDMATLTDRRPPTSIFRCKDAESLATDLDFDDYELHSPRNDSGILSDDAQNYAESNLSSADVSDLYPESGDKRVSCVDNSTNTFLASSGRNSAVQTAVRRLEAANRLKDNSENRSYSGCCSLIHELSQQARTNSPEKNVISISLPEMISITIESTNGLESRIAVIDGSDAVEEKPKPISSDKAAQTDKEIKNETEGSFLKDFTVKSTAIQTDGRVFRIENIFQDPKSKSCDDVSSEVKKETAMKKLVTFRSSLGTSSVIETKENGTETEWNGIYNGDVCQQTWPISKDSLTQAFIIKKRSYSLSPKRPHRLADDNLWKNWTLPCPERSKFIDYNREIRTTSPSIQQDINLELVDNLFSSLINSECSFVDTIPENTAQKSCNQDSKDNYKNLKKSKSISIKNLLNYDYNFSDDSLDYDDDNVAKETIEIKKMDLHDKNYESLCPPDVVAHTKKEASKSMNHVDSTDAEFSTSVRIDDDFDDIQIEFPKRKPDEVSEKNPLQDYKALILGTSLHVVDSDSEEEAKTKPLDNSKKKVSFLNPSSIEEITDVVTNRKILASKQNSEVALKPIIKKVKKKKPVVTESLDIIQSNVKIDQSLQQKKIKSTKSEEVLPTLKKKSDSENSEESLNNEKIKFSNEDPRNKVVKDSVAIDKDAHFRTSSKRNILEEYLSEAITFMRNMNSMNEYMSATNMLENYGKRRRRGGRRGNNPSTDKDYTEFRGRKVSLKDDTDKYLQSDNDEIVAIESYVKCLKGIERLEACIDNVNKHNQVLRDRYGIDVESAGAKLSLASSSVDSKMSSISDDVIHQCGNAVSENNAENCDESNLSRISLPLLSSTRTDAAKQYTSNETEKYDAVTKIDKQDLDDKNNNITVDDLERKIFDQLMRAADLSKCWSLKQSQQERPRKISDLRSQSSTTYSKLRGTFQQDAHGILNFDKVPIAEDYLDYIRGIESSPWAFKKTKPLDQTNDISSRTSIGFGIDSKAFCGEDNDNLSDVDMSNKPTIFQIKHHDYLTDPTKSIEGGSPYTETEITRKSKDNLKTELTNSRFGDSFTVELKYPGSPRAKFLELLRERRRIVENSRGTSAF